MAKKKTTSSRSKKKSSTAQHLLPEGFWRGIFVYVLLPFVGILLLLGALGAGGSLPVELFNGLRWLMGYAAYVAPFIMVAAAFAIFRHPDKKLPIAQLLGAVVAFMALCGFLHILLVDEGADGNGFLSAAEAGEGGGMIGFLMTSLVSSFVAPWVGALIFLVLSGLSWLFVFKVRVETILGLFGGMVGTAESSEKATKAKGGDSFADIASKAKNFVKGSEKDAAKTAAKPVNQSAAEFTLNEGVPLQRSRSQSLKNSVKPPAPTEEEQEALTTSGDPDWKFPSTSLLDDKLEKADAGDVKGNAQIIVDTFADFNINVEIQSANVGPRVTQYTIKPPSGVKLSKITGLENNLALNLAAQSIRIEAPIPGKRAVGIEVPNNKSATVKMFGILEDKEWTKSKFALPFAIGRDISGQPMVAGLEKMPHLLIAGATGAGKSVTINTFLCSLLFSNSPADMKLILVDPKQVELTPYNDIPHLLTPVITEPDKTLSALKWAVAEMERRYSLLSEAGKRDIASFNALPNYDSMPFIVIVIDELADLMMVAARDVEALIVRIAQKARAVGIHLVLATQRPSVDVITGLIKANVPARISFTVTSQIDSRTIIDQGGAEKLLGMGDMLMTTAQLSKPKRVQGVFLSDDEIQAITDFVRTQRPPEYDEEIVSQQVNINTNGGVVADIDGDREDTMFKDAVQVVVDSGKASASLLQRRLRVGYARASRLVESMEQQGIVGPADGARPREVLISSMDDVFGIPKPEASEDPEEEQSSQPTGIDIRFDD